MKRTDEVKTLNDHRPKLRVAVGGFVEAAREVRMEESGARREGLSFSLEAVRALLRPCGGGPSAREGERAGPRSERGSARLGSRWRGVASPLQSHFRESGGAP